MYTTQILQYLIWPAFIAICWFAVITALRAYEKKFPVENRNSEIPRTPPDHPAPGDLSATDR